MQAMHMHVVALGDDRSNYVILGPSAPVVIGVLSSVSSIQVSGIYTLLVVALV